MNTIIAASDLFLPTWKTFSGGAFFGYLFVAWIIWPTITLGLLVADSAGAKFLGFVSLVCFGIFAINRDAEMITMFIAIPGIIIAGTIAGIIKGVTGGR